MLSKQKFITEDLADQGRLERFNLQDAKILPKESIHFFQKTNIKNTPIHVYDLGFNNKNKIIPISNHINKTGINALMEKQKKTITFYDITEIYQPQKNAKIAECFGAHLRPHPFNKKYIQTRYLCNHIISAYYAKIKLIFAYVVD